MKSCYSVSAAEVKIADIIDNVSTIVQHDPDFARTYLSEKRKIMEVMHVPQARAHWMGRLKSRAGVGRKADGPQWLAGIGDDGRFMTRLKLRSPARRATLGRISKPCRGLGKSCKQGNAQNHAAKKIDIHINMFLAAEAGVAVPGDELFRMSPT